MKIDLVFLIVLIIVIAYVFVNYKVETMADVPVTDQMKEAIKQIYLADVEAIRNLSNVATQLQKDGLTIPGQLKVGARLSTNGLDPANMPDGWGGGLRIFDGYSSGTIGFGPDGKKLNAYMNANGDMRSINMNTDNATINGNANVTGQLTTKSQINAIRKDGRATHFDYTDGKNYIRGDTQHDNNLTVGALTLRNGNWADGASDILVQDGIWGDWTETKMCPPGTYVCGLSTRFEKSQGDKDDTALNGIKMRCCKF